MRFASEISRQFLEFLGKSCQRLEHWVLARASDNDDRRGTAHFDVHSAASRELAYDAYVRSNHAAAASRSSVLRQDDR